MLIDAMRRLDNAIMPCCCAFCGTLCTSSEVSICAGCREDLPYIDHADPLPPLTKVVAPLRYAFPVDAAIKAVKFHRKLFYLPAFAELLSDVCSELPQDADVLLPVPLHWRRHVKRGFNQSAELCKYVRELVGVPVVNDVVRHRSTPFQSGLDAGQRRRNLANAFRLRKPILADHVVIVDDVVTTGATARAIARVLFDGGVRRVSVLAVART